MQSFLFIVLFSIKTCNTAMGGFSLGDTLEVCSEFWGECLFRPVISVLLPPGFCWISTWAWIFCGCAAYFWGTFPLECFWVTASVILLYFHYCFFCMYYFNVVHVFYIMRNSPSCDIFYCIIILKAICLIL